MIGKKSDVSQEYFHNLFQRTADIKVERIEFTLKHKTESFVLVYCEGLINSDLLIDSILPEIQKSAAMNGMKALKNVNSSATMKWVKYDPEIDKEIQEKVFDGYTVIVFQDVLYFFNTSEPPKRSPEESTTEVSVKGPRDGFVEDISTNIALVRKRLKTNSMVTKSFTIGRRSKTKVSIAYITDIHNKEMINEVVKRVEAIDIDILSSDSHLIQLISDSRYSLFPLLESVSRPDGVVRDLAMGRFAIFIDNIPNVVIGPGNFLFLLNTSEDQHLPFFYTSFEMLLRITGLFLAIFLPSFWLALSAYNVDQIPFSLLATIGASRLGIPFNTTFEMLLMITLFELFREAGVRLPKAVGQTVAVVGGLIVGDAAIRAGLTSPTMLVVSAITAVATFTLGNQSLFGTVTLIRIFSILCASVLGMYGFFLSLFMLIAYLAKLESFKIPYLSPISPFVKRDFMKAIINLPETLENERPHIMKTQDSDRQGDK
ncbi:spore germination protein [Lederbergia graminis]|uniref:Spore germination protein n=1 Tax=Lederbergia graminis TaxID=735518 RepID=A0ABW0LMH8_9BACI